MEKPHRKKGRRVETKSSSWADLPPDIQALILGKLNFVDIMSFRAACKNFADISDRLNIPWLCRLKVEHGRLECKIYDPYSRRIIKTWKYVESFKGVENFNDTSRFNYDIKVYCTKQGWLIAGYFDRYFKGHYCEGFYSMFMYKPCSKEFIWLPRTQCEPHLATFTSNPVSQDCQVFVYSYNFYDEKYYIRRYCFGDNRWRVQLVVEDKYFIRGFEYMNGHIFCLFEGGIMGRYSMADKSWTLLDPGNLKSIGKRRLWLTKGEGDLLMAVLEDEDAGKYLTCYFDWSTTCWVQRNLPETSTIFITCHLATFMRSDRVNTGNCNVHYIYGMDSCYFCTKKPSHYRLTMELL